MYRWDVELPAGDQLDLGEIAFLPGASVLGTVTSGSGVLPADVEVRAERVVHRIRSEGYERDRLTSTTVALDPDEKGWFQLSGLAPGLYRLVAEAEGFSLARSAELEILDAHEIWMDERLVLEPLSRLILELAPPLDPVGEPWRVVLLPLDEASGQPMREVSGPASREGRWERNGLSAGRHVLLVQDGQGSQWLERELTIRSGLPPQFIEIDHIEIVGEVRDGEGPVVATLVFGGAYGSPSIRFASDLDGEFHGYLPRGGTWQIEVFDPDSGHRVVVPDVEVEPRDDGRPTRLDLDLPETRLSGEVVFAGGETADGAVVTLVRRGERGIEAELRSDREGRFEVRWLVPGELLVHAQHVGGESAWTMIVLTEDRETAVRLTLEPREILRGFVTSPQGPVSGALVGALPRQGSGPAFAVQASTGFDGGFELDLPARAGGVDLLVLPPGRAARLIYLSAVPRERLQVDVDSLGGTLVLEIEGLVAGALLQAPLVLRHGSARVHPSALGRWGSITDGEGGFAIRLPAMEPGGYELCTRSADDLRCSSGTLSTAGELRISLALPSKAERSLR